MTTVTLTPAIVLGITLIVALVMRVSHRTLAVIGIAFGVSIAGGPCGAVIQGLNRDYTGVAGDGVGIANEQLDGDGGGVAPRRASRATVTTEMPADR